MVVAALALGACSDDSGSYYETEAVEPPAGAPQLPPAPLTESGLPEGHPPIDDSTAPDPVTMSNTQLPAELIAQDDLPGWTLPEGWTRAPDRAMRRASFAVGDSGLELAVTSFPGDVGGLEANVNRWRRQLGLGPMEAAEMESVVTTREIDGRTIQVVDLAAPSADGTGGTRMLTAIAQVEGVSWFFKVTGPDSAIADAKPEFETFIDSLSF